VALTNGDSAPVRKVSFPLRLAAWLLPADAREEVLRELLEQKEHIGAARGIATAWRWSWRQPLAALMALAPLTGGTMLQGLLEDLGNSQRSLRRRPALALTVAATIAVSVGAIAATTSVIDAVLLRPLPYPQAAELAWIASYYTMPGAKPFAADAVASYYANPMDVVDWARRERHLVALAPFETYEGTVLAGERPLRVDLAFVGVALGDVLRIQPALGRLFTAADYAPGVRAVVLSHELWRTAYSGDLGLVGRSVLLNDEPYEVVGILPASPLQFPAAATDAWLPLPPLAPTFQNRGGVWQQVVARLEPGVSLATAEADLKRVARELAQEFPDTNANRQIALVPLRTGLVGETASVLALLAGAVGLVLLIACANVGHLLLVSAQGRGRELALRGALGASAWRLGRLLMVESAWLALAGGTVGLWIAPWLLRSFQLLYPDTLPAVGEISIGLAAIAVALATMALAAFLAVLPSLVHLHGKQLYLTMRASERGSDSRRQRRLRGALVLAQVALSTTLLLGGGLLLQTFWAMRATDPGFAADSVLTFNLALAESRYPDLAAETRFHDQVLASVRALPGVRAAGTTTLLPLTSGEYIEAFSRQGFPDVYPNLPLARLQNVTAGYFEAIGLPLKAGRTLRDSDNAAGPAVVVVNEALQAKYFPDGALGRQIRFRELLAEIVGVVGDKHHRSLRETPRPDLFFPRAQVQEPRLFAWVAIRTAGDPLSLLPAVREAVRSQDPGVSLDNISTMAARLERALAPDRFRAFLVGALALAALLLAEIGLYGLIAYAVASSAHDIAIRMSLGASVGSTVRQILRAVMLLAGGGVLVGILVALAVRQWLAGFLVGVGMNDPLTIGVVALSLLALAALAASGPALRASRTDPARVLRGS
jgi:putative ABC transport system permease protein